MSSAVFSFRDVSGTKGIQVLSILMRAVTIVLFLVGALIIVGRDGSKGLEPPNYPAFNLDHFP